MHDIPRMTGGIRDDHAPPRAAFHDLAVTDIDGHMAVLRFGPRAGADDIPRYGIADTVADIVGAGIAGGTVAPVIGMHKVIEQTEAVKHMKTNQLQSVAPPLCSSSCLRLPGSVLF